MLEQGAGNINWVLCQQITLHDRAKKKRAGGPIRLPAQEMGSRMIRMHRFPISVHLYHARGKQNIFPELHGCQYPGCIYHGRLRRHGFYSRYAFTPGAVYIVWIQRYLCPMCGHTVSLLPTFLAPHFQYTLLAVFWILHGLHRLNLSISEMAARWNRRRNAPTELGRQNIQLILRRLRRNHRVYRLFLCADDSLPIGGLLLERLPRFGGIEGFSELFFREWRVPFLSKL